MKRTIRHGAFAALFGLAATTLLVVSSGALLAQAQQGDNNGGGTQQAPPEADPFAHIVRPLTPVMTLIRNADIQQDLKLTPQQVEKIKAKWDEQQETYHHSGPVEIRNRRIPKQPPTPQMMKDRLEQLTADEKRWVKELMDKSQKKRFDQLVLQYTGPIAIDLKIGGEIVGERYLYPEVNEKLKITVEERAKFKKINRDTFQRYHLLVSQTDYPHLPPKQSKEFMEKLAAINNSNPERKLALLTDEQKAVWKAMLGEPFSFPPSLQNHWNTPQAQP